MLAMVASEPCSGAIFSRQEEGMVGSSESEGAVGRSKEHLAGLQQFHSALEKLHSAEAELAKVRAELAGKGLDLDVRDEMHW